MSSKVKINFVDNYIKYLVNKYFIFTHENNQTEICDIEIFKSKLDKIDLSKIKNTDKHMINLTKQIASTFLCIAICTKKPIDLDDKIYLHYKKYKCLKYSTHSSDECC